MRSSRTNRAQQTCHNQDETSAINTDSHLEIGKRSNLYYLFVKK